jgi:hypothetical protein
LTNEPNITRSAKLLVQPTKGQHRTLDLTRKGDKNVTVQEEQTFVDRVPTDAMSALTTPVAPALSGSVIRDVLSTNAKKKQRNQQSPLQTAERS